MYSMVWHYGWLYGHMVIGVGLSESHTSVTAFRKLCVCLRPYTVNAYLNISMKTKHPQPAHAHAICDNAQPAVVSVKGYC